MGLRGGNLLFHLQKLQESRMIMQRKDRGDYMITEKGFATLIAIGELYADLGGKRTVVESEKVTQAMSS